MIRDVADADVERVRAFLEAHVETSLFLLSNLADYGPRVGEAMNSGNFRFVEEGGVPVAVGCVARRGIFLVQSGGRRDAARELLDACMSDPFRISAVIGEWEGADAAWNALCADSKFRSTSASKERLYRLDLGVVRQQDLSARVRPLETSDFEQWYDLNSSYLREEELPVFGSEKQRRAMFEGQVAARHWWGAFDGARLVSIAGLNAAYGRLGQVGGVFTPPEQRRRGLSRSVMERLLADAKGLLGLEKLILFTGERNVAARALYESMGFEPIGDFALLFGAWDGDES